MKFLWIGKNEASRKRETEVREKVISDKNKFKVVMKKLEKEAIDIHKQHTTQLVKSKKINKNIEDLATRIALIMGTD